MRRLSSTLTALTLLAVLTISRCNATDVFISTANSTVTPLAASGNFQGTFEDVSVFDVITIQVDANVDGLNPAAISVQFSSDGVTPNVTDAYSFWAKNEFTNGNGAALIIRPKARYFRIRYNNGATVQATFHLTCLYHYSGAAVAQSHGVNFPLWQILPSASRTVQQTIDIYKWSNGGFVLALSVSSNGGAGHTLNLDVNMVAAGGPAATVARLARITTVAAVNQQYYLIVSPGSTGTPDTATQIKTYGLAVPRRIQVQVTPSGAAACTYELSFQELP